MDQDVVQPEVDNEDPTTIDGKENKKPLSEVPNLINSVGESEPDTRSPRWNLIEGIVMYASVMIVMWGIIWPFALDPAGPRLKDIEILGYVLLGCLALWAIILSPILHKDTFNGVGLGNPKLCIQFFAERRRKYGIVKGLYPLALLFLFLIYGYSSQITYIIKAFKIGSLATWLLMIPLCLLATVLVAFFAIRWDNFMTKTCGQVILAGWLIVGAILIPLGLYYSVTGAQDWFAFIGYFASGNDKLLVSWWNYIWWGFIQQWLFLGYFNTRLRKGNPKGKYRGFAANIWVGIVNMFYFGLFHVPAWYLALFAFTGGLFFAWVFQPDKHRNLWAMAIIQGFGGALLGLLPWKLSVGPWAA